MKATTKKILMLGTAAVLSLGILAGCSKTDDPTTDPNPVDPGPEDPIVDARPIDVISREDGSGTRGAFVELFGIEDADGNDATKPTAEITSSTSVMMTTVDGNPSAIGYISLGSLNDNVKALQIDGVEATVENIIDGSYSISRPFNIAMSAELSAVADDFINFIMSKEGQDIIEEKGYIRMTEGTPFDGTLTPGLIVIAGSSSVSPVMEALAEGYMAINRNSDIQIQTSDSSTGMNAVAEGVCDIGMASRDLKDSELEKGIEGTTIAMDGIAVIVNYANKIDSLSKDQVRDIFNGTVEDWTELN